MVEVTIQTLARASYLVHPQVVGHLRDAAPLNEGVKAAVLLSVESNRLGPAEVKQTLECFAREDDVYSDDFGACCIVQSTQDNDIGYVGAKTRARKSFTNIYEIEPSPRHGALPPGPYFIRGRAIHQAWKLYDDNLDAFVIPVVANDAQNPDKFSVLQAVSTEGSFRCVAVPSRLYATRSDDKPLAGVRISIKDNYDLHGIRTTMMNRAYNELYPPRQSSADFVQKLIRLGAVIVGKTKMSAFASAEEPTDQWVDYHCPFNPRADKYQTPSCSSAGAGAGLAGYEWLDHAIGSDTSGSIRLPAAWNGLFGVRTSYGKISRQGIVPSCNEFDTVASLHRSLLDAKIFASASFGLADSAQFPQRILYPSDFFPHADEQQQGMVEEFVSKAESFLRTKRTPINLAEEWTKNPPKEAGDRSLQEYLEMSAVWPMYYDTYHTFDDFRAKYRAKYGFEPFVGPYMRKRWDIAVPFTKEERAKGVAEMAIFRQWFSENIMWPDQKALSNAVMIMPFGAATPSYRDDNNKLPSIVGSFSIFYLAAVLQLPQLIIPIGQKPYESRVTGTTEHLPIVSSFMGASGSDLMLINLAEAVLKNANWATEVKTGQYAFPLGANNRNVRDPQAVVKGECLIS